VPLFLLYDFSFNPQAHAKLTACISPSLLPRLVSMSWFFNTKARHTQRQQQQQQQQQQEEDARF
jgi:hypothetical protein